MTKRPEIQNKRFWNLTSESLRYIAKDAKEAADNLPDCPKTGVWLDEVNDACTVLYHRSKEAK
ncbi:hypothetical protein CMI37_38535 [Candidatus Pacearchaeota archaeon]|nr:hypothetical protein [Candidatus Pacearchaeota archaeon]